MLLSDYPQSEAMYPESVDPPLVTPVNSANPATFNIDCSWYPYIVGALKSLRQQGTWRTSSDLELISVLDYVDTLLEHMSTVILATCSEILLPFACYYDFEASSSGWEVIPPFDVGVWSSELGWGGTFGDVHSQQDCYIKHDFPAPITLTHIDYSITSGLGGMGPNQGTYAVAVRSAGNVSLGHMDLHAGTLTYAWDGTLDGVTSIYIDCNSGDIIGNNYIFVANIEGLDGSGTCEG